jgi:hypothetical protein
MKRILFLQVTILMALVSAQGQNVGLGTATPNASAALDISATNRGLLLPRMTTAARNSIGAPAKGLMVYDSTLGTFTFHNGTAWTELLHAGNNVWLKNGANIYTNAPNVGIGTTDPQAGLHIVSASNNAAFSRFILLESTADLASAGEPAISFRNKSFSAGKQWSVGINQTLPALSFSFGTTFAASNTRMIIDTIGRIGMGTTTPDSSAQ